MNIQNSNTKDLNSIFKLYKIATDFQKNKAVVQWPDFDKALIEKEIEENRQWKMLIDGKVACVWATTNSDPQIWEEKDKDPSIYIHRIATHTDFKGRNLVAEIVKWAVTYAKQNNKQFVRLDTVGENTGLIKHYKNCGFDFLGLFKLNNTIELPKHYKNATVSLFQVKV